MGYSIKTMSEKVGLTEYTLRYYEKEGLLPVIERDGNGRRDFKDQDLDWITLICCLRDTGMSIADIKRYVALCKCGNSTVNARKQLLTDHKQDIEKKIKLFKKYSQKIDKKIEYYDKIEKVGETDCCNPYFKK